MRAYIVFSGTGPILILTTYPELTDGRLVEKLVHKGIAKFTAYVTVVIVLLAVFITKMRTDDSVIVEFAEPAQGLPEGVGAAVDPADVPVDAPVDPAPVDTTPADDEDGN